LGTETGRDKATKMMEILLGHYANEFAWLETCNEKTLKVQAENIYISMYIFSEMNRLLDNNFLEELDSHWKKIPFDKVGTFYLNQKNAGLSSLMRNFKDPQTLYSELQMVYLISMFAELTGSTATLQRADQIIETTLDEASKIDPRIASAIRGSFSRDRD